LELDRGAKKLAQIRVGWTASLKLAGTSLQVETEIQKIKAEA